ncbi:hypothetical protein H5A44_14270 [Pectobacterium brasiliense]|uniref:phage tail fiber protein n=1 Tax=Pectobacterium brasiliense TaxID=180957 RepID=UPI001969CB88|nr:hypothetical protein [Pectobacterium brasiliense]MBN3343597.1 hypothetical protein [Pectobacterium brasiliense]
MSEITPNDLPPINELDEFTSHIPELQIDTDVLAGTDGPANFQAQALANRTKYLKRILDAVSLELNGINQAVVTAQQVADTAKQGADASMKKAANGSDIVNSAAFRANIGLSNAMFKGEFGWGGSAPSITTPSLQEFLVTNKAVSGVYSADPSTVSGLPPGYGPCICVWEAGQLGAFGNLTVIDVTNADNRIARNTLSAELWQGWDYFWSSKNLNPMTTDTIQAINTLKVFIRNYASFMVQSGSVGAASWIEGQDNDGSTRWILGFPNDNDNMLSLRNYKGGALSLDAQSIVFPASKGFMRNARGVDYASGTAYGEYLKSEQSAGSSTVNGVWRTFISVRHKGGNSNQEANTASSTDWGWALVDNNMTQNSFNEFVLEKTYNGTWLPAVTLKHSGNTTVDANGFLKTASPIVKLFADGSSELNAESEGVVTERIGTGRYRISGCLGLNADLAWGGLEGGIAGPRCRNGLERLWIDYGVEPDGSIIVSTFHRTHPSAMIFSRNALEGYSEGDPIDIPRDTFLSIRVQMPAREEAHYVPVVASKFRHSNVYCNSVSPAK